nr:hypothetical protein [Tanacetum cinerariifolium]
MARLAFCDYHNMIAVLEKYELNTDFHQIVDFVEAFHLRIETTDEGTQILATVDGKQRTISESSIRRNLKLKDEAGISSLPDVELFENLTLMGYNILPNQKFSFQKGLGTPTEPHHTPSPKAQQTSPTATSSPSLLPVTTETIPTVIPTDTPEEIGLLSPQLFQLQQMSLHLQLGMTVKLKARVKLLEDRDGGGIERSTKKGSNNTEEMVKVLTSLDTTTVLSSGVSVSISPVTEVPVAKVPTGSGSIPTASPHGTGVPTCGVPTASSVVPTASLIFTTATLATPYTRRKGKEKMVESEPPKKKKLQEQMDVEMARQLEEEMERDAQRMNEQIARDAKIARIHAEEELQSMIDGLDRNNETVAKYLQEYYQFAAKLPIKERIELISNLVKYQDNYAKVLKYQILQRKPLSRKQQKEFYMSVLKSYAGWKARHFKGMTQKEIKEKFDPVWKQIEDFIPIGSKEESERFKRKGVRLEQDNAKKVKTSEEVLEEDLKDIMQLVPVEEVYVEALQHFDREDLNQLWALVKETLNIRQASNDKEKELWVELKRLYEPDVEDLL